MVYHVIETIALFNGHIRNSRTARKLAVFETREEAQYFAKSLVVPHEIVEVTQSK